MKNYNLFNRKDLKSFRSFLRDKATSAEAVLWDILKSKNQPPRPQTDFVIFRLELYCGHPSFKRRGEYYYLT